MRINLIALVILCCCPQCLLATAKATSTLFITSILRTTNNDVLYVNENDWGLGNQLQHLNTEVRRCAALAAHFASAGARRRLRFDSVQCTLPALYFHNNRNANANYVQEVALLNEADAVVRWLQRPWLAAHATHVHAAAWFNLSFTAPLPASLHISNDTRLSDLCDCDPSKSATEETSSSAAQNERCGTQCDAATIVVSNNIQRAKALVQHALPANITFIEHTDNARESSVFEASMSALIASLSECFLRDASAPRNGGVGSRRVVLAYTGENRERLVDDAYTIFNVRASVRREALHMASMATLSAAHDTAAAVTLASPLHFIGVRNYEWIMYAHSATTQALDELRELSDSMLPLTVDATRGGDNWARFWWRWVPVRVVARVIARHAAASSLATSAALSKNGAAHIATTVNEEATFFVAASEALDFGCALTRLTAALASAPGARVVLSRATAALKPRGCDVPRAAMGDSAASFTRAAHAWRNASEQSALLYDYALGRESTKSRGLCFTTHAKSTLYTAIRGGSGDDGGDGSLDCLCLHTLIPQHIGLYFNAFEMRAHTHAEYEARVNDRMNSQAKSSEESENSTASDFRTMYALKRASNQLMKQRYSFKFNHI